MASAPALATAASPSQVRLALAPGANLLGLLAAIDEAPGTRVFLDAADLPRALQTRTILTILRRRADRRGKRLHLVTASQTLWRLARLAELDGVAATEAAAVSLLEPREARMPDDAVPAVVIGAADEPMPRTEARSLQGGANAEPYTAVIPKVLGILARNELNLEPIPALDINPATTERPPELPAPKLASLVAWLDVDTRAPATGGSGPGGPEGPDDESWLPTGAASGARLPAPLPIGQGPRLRVVRVGQESMAPRVRGGLALRGGTAVDEADAPIYDVSVDEPAGETLDDARPTPTVRRATGRLLRSDVARDRIRERAGRRSLNRDRLDRLAGRGRVPTAATPPRPAREGLPHGSASTAATERVERVRRQIDDVAQRAPELGRTTVAPMAVAVVRTVLGAILVVLGVAWRLLTGIRLSGAAMVRLGAVAIIAAVVGAFTWYVVPSATVEIVPAVETWSTTVPVVVDPAARKADSVSGRVPGRWVVKEATESSQANATGKRVMPDGKAGGDAVFVNRSDRQIMVPKGTIVAGAGVRFATQSDVAVPPTQIGGVQKRIGVSRVPVVAEVGGTAGNLDRGKIATIEGPLNGQLDVQNDQPLRGGTERTIVFVSADDRRKLLETVQKTAIDKLAVQVKALTVDPTKEVAVPLGVVGTPVTIPGAQGPGVIEATFSKGENDEGSSVSVTVKARYAVTVFETAAVQQVAQAGATTMVAQQRPGFAPTGGVPRALVPEIGSVDATTGQVQVRVRVDASVAPIVTPSEIRAAIAGRTVDDARAALIKMPGIATYRLESWPAWSWKQTLPALGWRIGVATMTTTPNTASAT